MSAHNKKRFKNLGKTIAVGLFALLMFTNIQVALSDSTDFSDGDISILGIEVQLFEGTTAYDSGSYTWQTHTQSCDPTPDGRLCYWKCVSPHSTPDCSYGDSGYGYFPPGS